MRILAISDIHGCYDQFIKLLEKVNYNSETDSLVLLGDYCDRGLKSRQVIDKCIELKDKGAVTLKGNHDDMFLKWLLTDNETNLYMFLQNGGIATIESYLGYDWIEQGLTWENYQIAKKFILKHYSHHVKFLKDLQLYHQIDNYVFVHAGVNPNLESWKNTSGHDFLWIRDEFLSNNHSYKETVVHGHTPCRLIHGRDDICVKKGKISIDGGCCFNGQLNCLEINGTDYVSHYIK